MGNPEREECYGSMFPDPLHFVDNRPTSGRVFGFKTERSPMGPRSDRSIQVDEEAWRQCLACPRFTDCYQLCMAKMALAAAIASQ